MLEDWQELVVLGGKKGGLPGECVMVHNVILFAGGVVVLVNCLLVDAIATLSPSGSTYAQPDISLDCTPKLFMTKRSCKNASSKLLSE